MIGLNHLVPSRWSGISGSNSAGPMMVFRMGLLGALITIVTGVVCAQVQNKLADGPSVSGSTESQSEELQRPIQASTTASTSDSATQTRVRELIYILRHCRVASRTAEWGSAIRELATIGTPALPELLLELKTTDRSATLRALLFTLRVIDDRRTLAPVIEALPKAARLSTRGSDFVLQFVDADLQRFMKQHENFPHKDDRFHYGRPINEILGTLHKLASEPSPDSKNRRLFASTWSARYWQDWWQEHKNEIDALDGKQSIPLPARDVDLVERDGVRRFGPLFPTGPRQRLSPVASVNLPSVRYANERPYLDLDTGKLYESLEGWQFEPGKRFDVRDSRRWQTERGIDLALHNDFDTHLWLIDNDRWDSLEAEVQSGEPLDMGREAGLFTPVDKDPRDDKMDQIRTFLFTTADGGRGVMRVYPASAVGSKRIEYRLWNRDDLIVQPASQRRGPSSNEWQPVKFVLLKEPGFGNQCLYDFDEGKAAGLPESLAAEMQASEVDVLMKRGEIFSNDEIATWARKRGIDLATMRLAVAFGAVPEDAETKGLHNGQVGTLSLIDARSMSVTADAFETLTVAHAKEILSRSSSPFSLVWVNPEIDPTAPPATAIFQTKSGLVGLLQISSVGEELSSIGFRYKLADPNAR